MIESIETQNRILSLIGSGEHLVLSGPPATGKSSFIRRTAEALALPLHAFPVTRGASGQALFASISPDKDGRWGRNDGPCTRSAREGAILLLDDIHVAGADVESALYSAVDRHEIELPWGEVIAPKGGYQVIATSNVSPEKLPPAIRSRFAIEIPVNGILPATVEGMPKWAADLLASQTLTQNPGVTPIDSRNIWAAIRLSQKYGRAQSLALVFGASQGQEIESACIMKERA